MAEWRSECYIEQVEPAKASSDERPSAGPVYRSVFASSSPPSHASNLDTCWDLFSESVKRCPNNRMLGHRTKQGDKVGDYAWQTYKEVYDTVVAVGSAMRTSGLDPKARCGVYGSNCPEWLIAMEILKCLPKCADYLKTIISFGELTEEHRKEAHNFNVIAYSWTEFVTLGKNNPVDLMPPKKDDISTIMYTSGTTGEPKGVLLTHENITDVIDGVDRLLAALGEKMTEKDVYFSFLPLAHIFDRLIEEYSVRSGAAIGFWQGDVKLVLEDVGALKPTIFAGVPRVYDRVYTGALQKVSAGGFLKKKFFDLGYHYKLGRMLRGTKQENASPLFDSLVFSKIKQGLGGHVRILLSGAAPLAIHVEEFLRVTTCSLAVQGYGLTETCAASFVSVPDVMSMMGTVGVPLPNIEVCLESVPELGYDALAEPARGEVCIRGKSVFAGYHKREDLTNEVIADGWFHTGDIGEWQKDGALKLIDRKKNIFKLSQGEYVAVENLENIYSIAPVVESIWIYGNSFEASLVAIVVPSQVVLEDWAKANNLEGNFHQLCNNEKVKEHVLSELRVIAKTKKLKGFEIIKAAHLEPQPFDLERDLITPTYKKKRPQLLKYYKEVINHLYQTLKSV